MKKSFFIFLLFLAFKSDTILAQPSFIWAESFYTSYLSEGTAITTDSSGNILMVGYFQDTIILGNDTLINPGTTSFMLVKFDAAGTPIWARAAAPGSGSFAEAVATDASGNIYVSGSFSGTQLTVGSYNLINTVYGQFDVFIIKYDSFGNVLWARSEGGNNNEQAKTMAVDAAGNVYVTGYFEDNIMVIGTDTLWNIFYFAQQNFFLVKYDVSGNIVWSKCGEGQAYVEESHVTTDLFGHVYLAGSYRGINLVFDGDSLIPLSSSGMNMFLTKYDITGNEIWVKGWENPNGVEPSSLTADNAGKIIVTGYFMGPNQVFGTYNLSVQSLLNPFLVKFNTNGSVLWAKAPQCSDNFIGRNVAVGQSDNIFFTGGYANLNATAPFIVFDSDTLLIPSANVDPGYLVEYDSGGNFSCGEVLTTAGDDWFPVTAGATINTAYFSGDCYTTPVILGDDTLKGNAWEYAFLFNWGCGKFSSTSVAEDDHLENKLECFPNPATNQTEISFFLEEEADIEVYLYDSQGKIVMLINKENSSSGKNSIELNLKGFSAGIYFCKMSTSVGEEAHVLIALAN